MTIITEKTIPTKHIAKNNVHFTCCDCDHGPFSPVVEPVTLGSVHRDPIQKPILPIS